MGDMLSSATSGLLAFQRALDTTSHNISNANTDGFSRQRVQFATRLPQAFSNGFVGNGVETTTVERLFDNFVADETRSSSSILERLNTLADKSSTLDNLFSDSQVGLTASMQKFVSAFQDVATTPNSTPARQVVLGQAQGLRDRLQSFDQRLADTDAQVNSQLADEASTITSLAKNIADLNRNISVEQNATQQPPNDLLDQRDHLLDQLATHVNIQVTKQNDGSVIVAIGSQPLVTGNQSATVAVSPDLYDPSRNTVVVKNLGVSVDVSTRLSGGTLGGLLEFRRDLLDPTRNALGRLTIGITEQINAQQRAGIDLNGNVGTNMFSVGGVQPLARANNLGSGAIAVTRQQPSAGGLTDADYIVEFGASGWTLIRTDTGANVTMTGAGTVGSPFQADGLSIVVSGAPTVGDSFLVRPTRDAIGGMNLLLSDPTTIAAAVPIATTTTAANKGTGSISSGEVLDPTNAALLTPTSLQFDSTTTYRVNGAGPSIAYTPGANIDLNGWRVVVSGAPAIGDSFAVGPNTHPAGDNRNALKLADTFAASVFSGGTVSINSAAGSIVSKIGVATNQAQANQTAQQAIVNDNVKTKDALSGVNLDEEAANMLRFQQAYQASAQAIKVADTLFQTILAAVQR